MLQDVAGCEITAIGSLLGGNSHVLGALLCPGRAKEQTHAGDIHRRMRREDGVSSTLFSSSLKMEAVCSSETLQTFSATAVRDATVRIGIKP
jgi:hypothetical protein